MRAALLRVAAVAAALGIALTAVPFVAAAGGTRLWEIAGQEELEKGSAVRTAISSSGEVSLGLAATRLDLEGVGMVWSCLRGEDGSIFIGTGYDGRIFRVRGEKVEEIATTGQLVITALALDSQGDLYAAALPDPAIWKIPGAAGIEGEPIEAEKWAELPEPVEHVWALELDDEGRTLFAATGPEGQLWAVGRDAVPALHLETGEDHILSAARGPDGALLVGTSPEALLLEVTGPGRFRTLIDFDATEVKAIAVHEGAVIAAVNKFKRAPAIPTKKSSSAKKKARKAREVGDGSLWRILPDGRQEKLWERDDGHVVALAIDDGGRTFLGLGAEGKVVSVSPERISRTDLDLDERQVMALVAEGDLLFAGTGDAGSAYAVERSRKADAFYLSPPLDAGTTARWGRGGWYGSGRLLVESRSGNTAVPDESWSAWSAPLKREGEIPSDAARYLQLRFFWKRDAGAVLESAEVAYRPLNRRAVITELDPDSPFHGKGKPGKSKNKSDEKVVALSERTIEARPARGNDGELNLSWKVDNPDGDTLRYRLWYRAVGEDLWRPIIDEDYLLTRSRYDWKTETVPEGRYQIRLTADDSPSNDPSAVLSDELISVPVLVDNHQPRVKELRRRGDEIQGVAEDGFSAISALEMSLDGGPWLPLFCKDGIFDEAEEEFEIELPAELEAGPHAVAVRAYDRAGNAGTAEIHIEVEKRP
ncbi:MAG: hypothetical protein R6V85_20800 [Polyangia bacterium]